MRALVCIIIFVPFTEGHPYAVFTLCGHNSGDREGCINNINESPLRSRHAPSANDVNDETNAEQAPRYAR